MDTYGVDTAHIKRILAKSVSLSFNSIDSFKLFTSHFYRIYSFSSHITYKFIFPYTPVLACTRHGSV